MAALGHMKIEVFLREAHRADGPVIRAKVERVATAPGVCRRVEDAIKQVIENPAEAQIFSSDASNFFQSPHQSIAAYLS
jgi:hypothetical protein